MDLSTAIANHENEKFKASLFLVRQTLQLFGPEHVVCSFNGGKDATVVLHLVRAAFAELGDPAARVRCCHWVDRNEFPEVLEFVDQCEKEYNLEMWRFDGDMKEGMRELVEKRGIKAVFMGTRKLDPHGVHLAGFDMSTKGWPIFMRVNPVLTWVYVDIWDFLKRFNLSYCPLYDMGYTSLGSVLTTQKNPALAQNGGVQYRPASDLKDEHRERQGRGIPREVPPAIGLLIIGYENLLESASHEIMTTALRLLSRAGLPVSEIMHVRDDLAQIRFGFSNFYRSCTHVIACGGIGYRPNDITTQALGSLLGVGNFLSEELMAVVQARAGQQEVAQVYQRFASIPGRSEVLKVPDDGFIIQNGNIFLLTDDMDKFEAQLQHTISTILKDYTSATQIFTSVTVEVQADDFALCPIWEDVLKESSNQLRVGCHSVRGGPAGQEKTIIDLKSTSKAVVDDGLEKLQKKLADHHFEFRVVV